MNTSLIYLTLCFISFAVAATAQSKQLTQYPDQLTRDGHIVVLPDHGTVYIVSDLHAHWDDFNQWLRLTKLVERIQAGEDVYGLILGDAIDYKPDEPRHPPYGDTLILDRVMELEKQLGDKGKRLIYLRGNHEFAAADAYAMLKKQGMTAQNQAEFIRLLYESPLGAYYKQFNFIERMTDVHYEFLLNLPTAVIAKNGFVGIHAGPARFIRNLTDLVNPSPKTLEELLWPRPVIAYPGGYTLTHIKNFLEAIHANLLVVGHTPIHYFPSQNVRDGIATFGENQLIFSTGYSGSPGIPTYIEIDLSETYTSVHALKLGVNIHHLYNKTKKPKSD
ncbi:MAG: metallophosphoesterase [Candidatus Poribacteria bacterium]|nr:metallophosphoesterase [Candidatus Poribacteria bacterium]